MRLFLSSSRQSQHGAFSIMAAATLLMSLLFLVLVLDSGRLYLEQRRLQKVADTAALESIARIETGNCYSSPDNAQLFAEENARRNHFLTSSKQFISTRCVTITSVGGLRQVEILPQYNPAIEVTTANEVPASLVIKAQSLIGNIPSTIRLQATAVAERGEPTASFTVGAQLLRLENSRLLGQLLTKVGLKPEHLTVLDSNGLANATITPAGLLKALGVDVGIHQLKALSPQGLIDLVDTEVNLGDFLELLSVSAEIASDSVLGADLAVLSQGILSSPQLKNININLLGDETRAGLLSLISNSEGPLGSALDTQVNLGDIISTSILLGIHETGQGLRIKDLNILGLVQVELGIVEPPSIGVGPVGTQAYNAQVRLYLDVDSNNLLGGVLSLFNIRINLPIWIDLVAAHGTLEKISCDVQPATVDIKVESNILNACIGRIPDALKWSKSASCETYLENEVLIKLPGTEIERKIHIPALKHDVDLFNIAAGDTVSTSPNALALGHTVDGIVNELLDLLSGLFRKPATVPDSEYNPETDNNILIEKLATQYLQKSALPGGLYNVDNVTNLILNGGSELDENGKKVIPPLFDEDWIIPNGVPKPGLLLSIHWKDGTFTEAFKAFSQPQGLLGLLLPGQRKGYRFCGNLIDALVDWNSCIEHNLVKLLQEKPGGINMSSTIDGDSIADPKTSAETLQCKGLLCILLKPVILLLKPILNGVGGLLNVILADILGIEIGRTDVTVGSINCNNPMLVR